jgi:hypothetical protein
MIGRYDTLIPNPFEEAFANTAASNGITKLPISAKNK